ncbi:hypothetical protein [Chryseobacterium oryctis]|uniref:Esterase n=1 Tax=Chryseobacterium oryctis TaxID=2952618 RepID=A0ABT3HSU2_9FLAO|nr:hypothetical protein [Chryseobacterium oryctis]MCW3162745.1 hypothetical protein [Chryseobacterium oryctis]
MFRYFITTIALFIPFILFSQNIVKPNIDKYKKDTLILVSKNPEKGFYNDYLLYIPKGMKKHNKSILLVEPNNTGKLSDSIEFHQKSAINQAKGNSIGNNISTELKIPLLVPIFSRPASKPLVYTHALDRDVMLEKETELQRLDLQLINMIKDSKEKLKILNIPVDDKVFMNGFSASASFTNRFSLMHPEMLKAIAIGGFNGALIFPMKKLTNTKLNYPLGINDIEKISKTKFNKEAFQKIPQYIYMGELDDNDAVQFDDAYNLTERKIINSLMGETVQKRWKFGQEIYRKENLNVTFTTYKDVGHWTTSTMNINTILFFQKHLN